MGEKGEGDRKETSRKAGRERDNKTREGEKRGSHSRVFRPACLTGRKKKKKKKKKKHMRGKVRLSGRGGKLSERDEERGKGELNRHRQTKGPGSMRYIMSSLDLFGSGEK